MEIQIEDNLYDISKFNHPGGQVIKYYIGHDATNAFNQFHMKSKKARMFLSMLPHRKSPLTQEKRALLDDFEALTNSFHNEGLFRPNWLEVIIRIVEIFGMVYIGTILFLNKYYII